MLYIMGMNWIAERIYLTRIGKGLSQKDLAQKSGIPQPNLSRIEKGRDFQISTLFQIASALEVTPEELLKTEPPAALNKALFFQRDNIEKFIKRFVDKKNVPASQKPIVEMLEAICGSRRGARKKDVHLNWSRLKHTFSQDEIKAILSRIDKAKNRL